MNSSCCKKIFLRAGYAGILYTGAFFGSDNGWRQYKKETTREPPRDVSKFRLPWLVASRAIVGVAVAAVFPLRIITWNLETEPDDTEREN